MGILRASINLYQTEPYGYSYPAAWTNMQEVLMKMDLMKKEINLEEAYTNEFSQ